MCIAERIDKLFCRNRIGVILSMLCFCVSCNDAGEVRTKLKLAEKRIWEQPDSALEVLQSISFPENLKGEEQANYALLLTQAEYRCNIAATSDSLINIAVDYYMEGRDVDKRAASLLYKGGVLKDMGRDEDAILAYKEAESYIPQIKDARIKSYIYTGLGYLNQKNRNYALSMKYYRYAIDINTEQKQIDWKVSNLMNLANISSFWGNKDSTNLYYSQLLELVQKVDSSLQSKVYYNIGSYKNKNGKWTEAEKYLLLSMKHTSGDTSYKAQLLLADIYAKAGYKEKVDRLWASALNSSDMAVKAKIYYNLYLEATYEKKYEQSVNHLSKYISVVDTLRNRKSQTELFEIQKKYDQVVLLNQNAEMRNRWYATILISIVVIIILIVTFYISIYVYKKNKAKTLLRYKKEVIALQNVIDAYQLKIVEDETLHNDEKENLLHEINEMERLIKEKDTSIRRMEIIFKSKDVIIPIEYIEGLKVVMNIKSIENPYYEPAADREKLHNWLDLVHYQFASRLVEKYSLTGRERDVCYLKALELSDEKIACLLKMQLRSEERWIYRICEKFGFLKGNKDDLACFISEFKKG